MTFSAEAQRLMRAGRFREALPIAERAVAGARTCLAGHALLASILWHLGRAADAGRVVTGAAALAPGAADAYDGLAYVAMALDRHAEANALYRRATEVEPRTPRHWYNLACSERSLGRLEAAEHCCDRVIALDPAPHQACLLRSELRVQSPGANHIDELAGRLARPDLDTAARAYLGYALAKELDDVQRFEEAFPRFLAAAGARRAQLRYDVASDERRLERIAGAFAAADPGAAVPAPAPAPAGTVRDAGRCIFVVGLPRSGTTLVERILSGLPGTRSNGETDHFSRALQAAAAGRGDMVDRAAAADPAKVAAGYLERARAGDGSVKVIEKMPTNYLYLGAIHRALPDARIVWVRRAPLDACFAMFRTLFGEAYPFSYDFEELARYHAAFDRLMRQWRRMLGGRLHEVRYEELVTDPAAVGARLAGHCGLSWSADAIDVQNNTSVSLTASAAQVRRPIYGTSSGRWRHYRDALAPLIAALRAHGVELPADA